MVNKGGGKLDNKDDAKKSASKTESYEVVSAKAICEAADGQWNAGKKECTCKNMSGEEITTSDSDECYVQVEEEELNTTQIVCEDKGGTWSDNKCNCKDANGKDITTANPVAECVKQEVAAPVEEEEVEENSLYAKCKAVNGEIKSGECWCKNIIGIPQCTRNPDRDCVKDVTEANRRAAQGK